MMARPRTTPTARKIMLILFDFFAKGEFLSNFTPRCPARFVELYAAGNHAGVLMLFLVGGERGRCRGSGGAIGFETRLDVSEAEDLTGFQDLLADLFAVDVSAVGGIEIAHDHVGALEQNFAVMARDGLLRNLEGIVIQTPDCGFINLQFVRSASQSFAQYRQV